MVLRAHSIKNLLYHYKDYCTNHHVKKQTFPQYENDIEIFDNNNNEYEYNIQPCAFTSSLGVLSNSCFKNTFSYEKKKRN